MRYRIKDLAPGLDGLIVEGINDPGLDSIAVTKISNESVIVGDRSVSAPVVSGKLFIVKDCLQPIDDRAREYAHDNPFGKVLFEGRITKGNLEVVYTQYERCIAVNVIEDQTELKGLGKKTLYSQNFFGDEEFLFHVKSSIEECLANDEGAEDLIFVLRDIKETEYDG